MKEGFRRRLSIIVTLILTFVTIMGGIQYDTPKAFATTNGTTVHFYKPSDWGKVNIYYYDDGGEAQAWPGESMNSTGGNWYEFRIDSMKAPNVIFNDGAVRQIPGQNQPGISITSEIWYKDGKITSNNPDLPKGDISINIEKPDFWDEIWIWYDGDLSTPAWDTTVLRSSPGDMENYRVNWYTKKIKSTDKVEFLFNDGTWNKKLDNNGRDFETTKDIWIKKDGTILYEDPIKDIKPVSIELDGVSMMDVGDTITITSTIVYNDGTRVQKDVNWIIDDSSLASIANLISKETKITAIKAGELSLTATFEDLTATKKISITEIEVSDEYIKVFFKSPWDTAKIYYWATEPALPSVNWPGVNMTLEGDGWYSYTLDGIEAANLIFNNGYGSQTEDLKRTSGEWFYYNNSWTDKDPRIDITPPIITANPKPGIYEEDTLILSLTAKDNADINPKIYYTTDGSEPTINSDLYKEDIIINKDTIIKAIAVDKAGNTSTVYVLEYTLNQDTTPPVVVANPPSGRYLTAQNVTFTVSDNKDSSPKLYLSTDGRTPELTDVFLYNGQTIALNKDTVIRTIAIDASGNKTENYFTYNIGEYKSEDFREETIYFVMTTRFYDGDPSNNVHCWDDEQAKNPDSDPAWRGDFKGLTEKLDYIKALGFSAIWVTPPVKNASGYDYHGYHAINFSEIDPRYKTKYDNSAEEAYQKFIDAAHSKGMKVIQDIVLNHTGNFGEENIFPMFTRNDTTGLNEPIEEALTRIDNGRLPDNYDSLNPNIQYGARIDAMKEDKNDINHIYHHEKSLDWEGYTCQTGQIAGDCVDLNTENPYVADYLVDAYAKYINMGVDAFRIDTVKHVSRLTFNNEFIPKLQAVGGENFYMFGEVCTRVRDVWNRDNPALSTPFYTWKESKNYSWGDRLTNEASVEQNYYDNQSVSTQPSSDNTFLRGNTYHTPDISMKSGLDVIDFPMHWNFADARDAFRVAIYGDSTYNDATWNVVYVDSHDYAPDCAPENQRFALGQDVWAENLSLTFTFRGIPCLYYGSEIEFQKGKPIDVGPNAPLSQTGRAYFGDYIEGNVQVSDFGVYSNATGTMAETLSHPLAQHITRLNRIRREIPALQKGQYSVQDINGGGMAFKRRYTENGVDSFALVTISGNATFNNIPNGKYVDAITGQVIHVTNGSLSANCNGKGNMRIFVLDTPQNPAPGKIGNDTRYLY